MRWFLLLQSSGVSEIQPTVRGGIGRASTPDADDGAMSDFGKNLSQLRQTMPLLCWEPRTGPSQSVKAGVLTAVCQAPQHLASLRTLPLVLCAATHPPAAPGMHQAHTYRAWVLHQTATYLASHHLYVFAQMHLFSEAFPRPSN